MKKLARILIIITSVLLVSWLFLTIIAEKQGPATSLQLGILPRNHKALVVYDPDPFNNLDQKICESFGNVFSKKQWNVTIKTVAATLGSDSSYDLYIFCANTYNWSPDWAITGVIDKMKLENKNVVAIILGGGSTKRSQRVFENIIEDKKANLIASKSFWLWKPNDKQRMKESNVEVAVDMAEKWAEVLADSINIAQIITQKI